MGKFRTLTDPVRCYYAANDPYDDKRKHHLRMLDHAPMKMHVFDTQKLPRKKWQKNVAQSAHTYRSKKPDHY